MSSVEEEKRIKSVDYILQSARAVKAMGGERIIVHTGSCGKISREEAIEKNNEAFEKLCENAPLVREYVDAKAKFDAVVNQVNTIINFYITGSTGDCTHDCSTCGGCH